MVRSMTGYGESERVTPQGRFRVSLRTVNHRFFNPHVRLLPGLERWEGEVLSWLKGRFQRGHLTLTLSWDRGGSEAEGTPPPVNFERARSFAALVKTLQQELQLPPGGELEVLFRYGGLFSPAEMGLASPELDLQLLRELVEEAVQAALAAREKEGAQLERDLLERVRAMEEHVRLVEERAPQRLLRERDRLAAAIAQLLDKPDRDEERLAREVAYLAEKWDIHEEIVRLRAHLEAFREAVAGSGEEPVGKRLGFLVQEMHREANTIASKANDLDIARASLALREEIERLREQVENVE